MTRLFHIFITLAFPQVLFGQLALSSTNYRLPTTCSEIQVFSEEVLDSSYFFAKSAAKIVEIILLNESFKTCDYYPAVLTISGFQDYLANDIIKSRETLLEADSIYRSSDKIDVKYKIRNKIFLGLNYNLLHDKIKSIAYYQSAIELSIKNNNISMLADAKNNLGSLYLDYNEIDEAKRLIEESLLHAMESNNLEILAFANFTYSRFYRETDNYESAEKHIIEARNIFTKINQPRNNYLLDLALAELQIKKKEYSKAIQNFKQAELRGNKTNYKFQHGLIYKNLGDLYKDKNSATSLDYYEKAQAFNSGLSKEQYSSVIEEITKSYANIGNTDKFVELVNKLQIYQSEKDREKEIEINESINRSILMQREITQNKLLTLKNAESKRRIWLIAVASLICLMAAFYSLFQWIKNKKLNKKISQQNIKLNKQNVELKNFAYIASHDLKEPVRSISSFATLVSQLIPESSDTKIFKYMDIIKSSSIRMDSLVTSLLQFSNLENLEIEKVKIDPEKLITEILNNLYSLIELKNAEIEVTKNLPNSIQGDKILLGIVFQNIINNALKFVKEDKIPQVKIEYERIKSYDVFKIIDNGIGVEDKYLSKIFYIFERLNSSCTFEGSGIGLSTCKRIIDLHKGRLEIESKVGEGSTLIISLPNTIGSM